MSKLLPEICKKCMNGTKFLGCAWKSFDNEYCGELKELVVLLERATPVKCTPNGGCPNNGCDADPEYATSFCPECGQALLHGNWLDDKHYKMGVIKK